ncbi:uncharacterized protein LOC143063433 [Mytilus galloprovincialis]|uniref:RING-type domain-containing protein n=2 Tax=Mytilus TaxID=6548 RepID=A0A8B6FL78_MYTGA|nr:unnamed protein product [Mytilus edulis]VDI49692.1 Hypothetical predicted protein [Mytilus galloprovincialis]
MAADVSRPTTVSVNGSKSKAGQGVDLTKCHLCKNTYTAPKQLPCLHSYCEDCIIKNLKSALDTDSTAQLKCPICIAPLPDARTKDVNSLVNKLPTDHFISALMVQDVLKTKVCKTCQINNKKTDAASWCAYCAEAMCEEHAVRHNAMTPRDTHKVNAISEIEKDPSLVYPPTFCTKQKHGRKKLEKYCMDHKKLLCSDCRSLHHSECRVADIKHAVDAMKNTFGVTAVDKMKMEVANIIKNREQNITDLNNQKTQKEAAIKTLRDVINQHLDSLEVTLKEELSKAHAAEIEDMNKDIKSFKDKDATLDHYKILAEAVGRSTTDAQAYHQVEKLIEQVKILDEHVYHKKSMLSKSEVDIIPLDVTGNITQLAEVKVRQTKPKIEGKEESKVSVHTAHSTIIERERRNKFLALKFQCSFISGGISLNSNLFLVDNRGKELRSYTEYGKRDTTLTFSLPGNPFDVALLPQKKNRDVVAITFPKDNQIQLIEIGNISLEKQLKHFYKTTDKGYGLASTGTKLIVACKSKLDIWDITEEHKLMHEKSIPTKGDKVKYVAVADDSRIYYTDSSERGTLNCVNMDGVNIFQYSHKHLKLPMGVAIDSKGHVYVCGFHSNNVHQVSPEANLLEIMTPEDPHFRKPIALIPNAGKMFVSYENNAITLL